MLYINILNFQQNVIINKQLFLMLNLFHDLHLIPFHNIIMHLINHYSLI